MLATACLFGSIIGILGGVYVVDALGGVANGSLVWWAWIAVALLGAGFVHLQVLGAGALITVVVQDETAAPRSASEGQEFQRSSQEQ